MRTKSKGSSSDSNATNSARKILANSNSNSSERRLWIDDCPCFGCPYDENSECIDLEYSTSCAYIEAWALGLRSPNANNENNKNVKTHVTPPSKRPSRWKMHSRHRPNSEESHGR